jgi:hypothetical protein
MLGQVLQIEEAKRGLMFLPSHLQALIAFSGVSPLQSSVDPRLATNGTCLTGY